MSIVDFISQEAKTAKWVGVLLIIAGFLALIAPLVAGISIAVFVGVLFIVSGVAQLFLVLKTGSFGRGLLLAVLALLSLAVGVYMVLQPVAALASLTLFLAAYFMVSGLLEVIAAIGARPSSGWGWLLFGGIVSILLGLMIWRQFPVSGVWAIGTLAGIRMLMSGWTWITIGGLGKAAANAAAQ